jgi:amino acid transporter
MEELERKTLFAREATGLTRQLGGWSVLIGNIMVMGIGYGLVFGFFSSLLYPGVDLPYTAVFAILLGFLFSAIYYLFTVAMPRTGGDYVWVSRSVHPSAGFVGNLLVTFVLITTNGVVAAWIVLYGLSPMFAGLGLVNSSPSLLKLATTVATLPTSFIISLVILCVFITPLFFSTKTIFRYLSVIFGIALISTLVVVGAFLSAPNGAFISNFDRLSGMNYANIITTAGIPRGFALSATLTGSVFTLINFLGFNNSAYYAGEVRHAKRSQLMGMFGAVVLGGLIIILLYSSVYYSAGSDFMNAISFLAGSANSAYTLPAAPTLNLLAVFASPNPFVVVASSLALIATSIGSLSAFTFVCVRNVFAWSFDRLLPSWLANVDSKRGSPYASVILIWIISAASVVIYYYTVFFQYYIYSATMDFITFGLASIAAIIFPFVKKSMFESSPEIVKKKLGGFPILSILGIVGLVVSIFVAYSSVTPAVTPPPSGPPLVHYLAYAIIPLTIIGGLIIYTVSFYYRKSKGMNLALSFKEIPPE